MSKKKILLAGQSWVSTATRIKGFDQFPTVTYHTGADELLAMDCALACQLLLTDWESHAGALPSAIQPRH